MGIDPGTSGAAVVLPECPSVVTELNQDNSCRFCKCTEKDIIEWFHKVCDRCGGDVKAVIEKVTPYPVQWRGSIASFKLGVSYGFVRCCLLSNNIQIQPVRPQDWQSKMQCMSKGDKKVIRARAQELFPRCKFTVDTADALVIAEYCRRFFKGIGYDRVD